MPMVLNSLTSPDSKHTMSRANELAALAFRNQQVVTQQAYAQSPHLFTTNQTNSVQRLNDNITLLESEHFNDQLNSLDVALHQRLVDQPTTILPAVGNIPAMPSTEGLNIQGFSKRNLRYGTGTASKAKDSFDRVTTDDLERRGKQVNHNRGNSMALQGIAQVDLTINKGKKSDQKRRGADLVDLSGDSGQELQVSGVGTNQQSALRLRNNQSSKVSFLKKIKAPAINTSSK